MQWSRVTKRERERRRCHCHAVSHVCLSRGDHHPACPLCEGLFSAGTSSLPHMPPLFPFLPLPPLHRSQPLSPPARLPHFSASSLLFLCHYCRGEPGLPATFSTGHTAESLLPCFFSQRCQRPVAQPCQSPLHVIISLL